MSNLTLDELRAHIRDVPDFPRPGIVFKDLTPLLADGRAMRTVQAMLAERLAPHRPELVVGIESRGFIFAATAAVALGVGLVPVRKPGKLPWRKRRVEYELEYGFDALEMHEDAIAPGQRVAVIDDLLATGGTAGATARLAEMHGANVVCAAFVIELAFLGGRARLEPLTVDALLSFG